METLSHAYSRPFHGSRTQGQGCSCRSRPDDELGVSEKSSVAYSPLLTPSFSRIAQGGRNWEGFGADPFLAGEAAYETILGMQEAGVQACAKHYINK